MFNPAFPGRRRVDFSGKSQLEGKQALLNRTRQERQQRQDQQSKNSAASCIQRWYRSHVQRKRSRSALRLVFDAEWKRYAAILAASQSIHTPVDRQALLMRLVRLLWLLYGDRQDGMRLVSLLAAVVRSNDNAVTSANSFYHTRPADALQPWPLQASHLCVLCLSKLISDTKDSASSPPAPADKRVYGLVSAALSGLLDHSRWTVKGADAAAVQASAVQHQQLLDCLSSSRAFFPALRLLLARLCPDDPSAPTSPYAVALLTAVVSALTASSKAGPADPFTKPFVTEVLTIPCIAAHLRQPALLPLISAHSGELTARLLGCTVRLLHTAPSLRSALPSSSSSIPSFALLLGNLVQLAATLDLKHAPISTLLDHLHVTSSLLQSLPPHLLHEDDEEALVWPFDSSLRPATPIRLPAHSIPPPRH